MRPLASTMLIKYNANKNEKSTYDVIPILHNSRKRQTHRER